MKHLSIKSNYILFVLFFLFINSCKHKTEIATRTVRGGPEKVIIDNKTPLKKLIKRLDGPWEWAETGAGYWIGYTDDMFSIANYKRKAIKPLISFINSDTSEKARLGALVTIHLIGINSHVAGRQYEEFKDTVARKALISFMDQTDLHEYVIFLIRRDPWATDIPYLINYLSEPNQNYSYVLNVLRRYQMFFNFLPIWTPVPDSILNKELDIYYPDDRSNSQICKVIALRNALNDKVIIDKRIINSEEWEKGLECFKKKTNHELITSMNEHNQIIGYSKPTISDLDDFFFHPYADYINIHDKLINYSYKNDTLYIFSQEGAREQILNYWRTLNSEQIKELTTKTK